MRKLFPLSLLVISITIIFGTIEVTTQQSLRLGANDPQIQLAQDTAASLNSGTSAKNIINSKVDIARSLAPFVIIYDKSGHVVAGSGYLNNQIPAVPSGVLTEAKSQDYNAVTWQPQSDVRIASVTTIANNYYSPARSLSLCIFDA